MRCRLLVLLLRGSRDMNCLDLEATPKGGGGLWEEVSSAHELCRLGGF